MIPAPIVAATVAFAALCILGDVRTRRIPNLLSGFAVVAGIVLNTIYFGTDGLLASLGGFLVTVGLLLAPFALGGLGGGDVKMMGAIGALLGPRVTVLALLVGLAFGGVVMAIHLVRLGRLRETLVNIVTMVAASMVGGSLEPLRMSPGQPGAITLPYSVPLGFGTLAVLAALGSPSL
jgi:prepilin peptidase CpaA